MLDNECVLLTPNSPVNAAKEIYVNNFPSRLIVLKQIEECFQKISFAFLFSFRSEVCSY